MKSYLSKVTGNFTDWVGRDILGRSRPYKKRKRSRSSSPHPYTNILFSYIGSSIGIGALAYLSAATHYPLIVPPFGATSVLAFAVPDSPFVQPRNIIGGNFLGALVGLIFLHIFGSHPWVMALAIATAIALMQLTKTLHPAAGAIALVAVMSRASWDFLVTPILLGSAILVLCSVVFNNLVPGRTYPQRWL